MCDTMWRQFETSSVFAKNSDRSCNEPNLSVFLRGGKTHEREVKCTYISIPQAEYVYSVLLVKPSWTWGAEMGVNEWGVSIGNEALFTKGSDKKTERLIGMDIVRLALERSKTAKEAVDVVKYLIETYGQGGNCGFDGKFYYDNSFLICDKDKAFIMETCGGRWALKKLHIFGNISNRIFLTKDYSNCNFDKTIDFKKTYTEPLRTKFSGSKERADKVLDLLSKSASLSDVLSILRSHYAPDERNLFATGSVRSVCMHQSLLGSHTTGSMAVEYNADGFVVWLTGSSTPCRSIFKPVVFGHLSGPVTDDEELSAANWLLRENVQRAVTAGLLGADLFQKRLAAMETGFLNKYAELKDKRADIDELTAFCDKCGAEEDAFYSEYAETAETLSDNLNLLPKLWRKKTERLGKNIFSKKLSERIK